MEKGEVHIMVLEMVLDRVLSQKAQLIGLVGAGYELHDPSHWDVIASPFPIFPWPGHPVLSNPEPLVAIFIRKEALLGSRIEITQFSLPDVLGADGY